LLRLIGLRVDFGTPPWRLCEKGEVSLAHFAILVVWAAPHRISFSLRTSHLVAPVRCVTRPASLEVIRCGVTPTWSALCIFLEPRWHIDLVIF